MIEAEKCFADGDRCFKQVVLDVKINVRPSPEIDGLISRVELLIG